MWTLLDLCLAIFEYFKKILAPFLRLLKWFELPCHALCEAVIRFSLQSRYFLVPNTFYRWNFEIRQQEFELLFGQTETRIRGTMERQMDVEIEIVIEVFNNFYSCLTQSLPKFLRWFTSKNNLHLKQFPPMNISECCKLLYNVYNILSSLPFSSYVMLLWLNIKHTLLWYENRKIFSSFSLIPRWYPPDANMKGYLMSMVGR